MSASSGTEDPLQYKDAIIYEVPVKSFFDANNDGIGDFVLIELVVNHTSDQHEWFQMAQHAPAGSTRRDFDVWSDTEQKYQDVRIIFIDTEQSNWAWDPIAKAYHWHRSFHQPDLNYDNPAVLDEVLRVMDFWLEMGVDEDRAGATAQGPGPAVWR